MPSPVLSTKLFPPARRPQLVGRPRLTDRLDATLTAGHRLTLVSAPAGFGKTTVLGDWLAHVAQRKPHTRVGWLSLDDGDNDLSRLMAHLVASLNSLGLDVNPDVLESLDRSPDLSLDAVSTSDALIGVVNDVVLAGELAPGEMWVLVLDDYHVLEAPAVNEAMSFLVDHLPDHLHLVLATRSDPALPLARMRSGGLLTELRVADLRFTPDEASGFLTKAMALDLTSADVEALEERTEGWIAGLQLAALSLRAISERAEIAGFIEAFTGSNRFVIDYLADEVLARQPAAVRDFLFATAVLDRLTGPVCDAVTGRTDGAGRARQREQDPTG